MNALREKLDASINAHGTDTWSAYFGTIFELDGRDTRYAPHETLNWAKGTRRTSPWLYCRRLPTEDAEKLLREKGWSYSPWREDPLWGDLVAAEQNSTALKAVASLQYQEEVSCWAASQEALKKEREEVLNLICQIETLDPALAGALSERAPIHALQHLLKCLKG
jgi:hypothetical protein